MKSLRTYIDNTKSVITGNDLKIIHKFENFPVFFGCTDSPKKNDLAANMIWGIDSKSGAIQLTKLVPLEILYQEQHVDGTGLTWKKYYEDFAIFIQKQNPRNVLEIGGGAGQLAQNVTKASSKIKWTVIEPNPIIKNTKQIKVIKGFFDSSLKVKDKINTIILSQVLEHVYNPREFISKIYEFLPVRGKVIIAYPQITTWLNKKYTNALNFEHTMLIDDFIEYLFIEQGFIIKKKNKYKDHSTFIVAEKGIKKKLNINIPNKYYEYKRLFLNFISYHKKLVRELNLKIKKSKEPVYLFGAHIFATYLFSFGLSMNLAGILDNSLLKQNRRFYGTNFIVSSPSILKKLKKVNIICRAGLYTDEIKKNILENVNPNVKFW
jgi:2-polyprenyl-3-methyl-5-hydroxy-6-metoxy-1,4-benzoquinol methylase